MTDKMVFIWKNLNVANQYTEMTRNKDKAIRDQFKADMNVHGTKSWALGLAMSMSNPSVQISDSDADLIISLLSEDNK